MNKPCHVCQALVDKIATQDAAARAMLATLQTIKENFDYGRAMAHGTPSYFMLLGTIAQAKAAGIT